MKRVLIVYHKMIVGGSTTSLLSLLSEIDYSKYKVDLLLLYKGGALEGQIPSKVNVLKYGYYIQNPLLLKLYKLTNPKYLINKIKSKLIARKYHNSRASYQYMSYLNLEPYRQIKDEYDVAVGYLEGYCNNYVAKCVNSKKKIAWIHINYEDCNLIPEFDMESFSIVDNIVAVSEECKKALQRKFPEYYNKIVSIDNILSKKRLVELSREKIDISVDKSKINLVSSCRIDFSSKGLDRAVKQIKKLIDDNVKNIDKLRWYIIGDGNNYNQLAQMIKTYGLSEHVILIGNKINPYPYIVKMSLFFQPSIFEGKPMAVTEGQILGLPTLATNYSSAHEQITDGFDGKVVENSEEGVYSGLKYILENEHLIEIWKNNMNLKDYSNIEEIDKFVRIIE